MTFVQPGDSSQSSAPDSPPKNTPLPRAVSQTSALFPAPCGAYIVVRFCQDSATGSHSQNSVVATGAPVAPTTYTRRRTGSYAATALVRGAGREPSDNLVGRKLQAPPTPSHSHKSGDGPPLGKASPP